ncbi:MAG: zinc transporter ZnuA [Actinomycetota bacterium]
MKRLVVGALACGLLVSCAPTEEAKPEASIVVTYSILGALVSEIVGDAALVTTVIPDGQDPHDFEPSAKDIELLNDANLIVSNGLDFEEGLSEAIQAAEDRGVPHFVVSDHVTTRTGDDHSHESDGSDHSEDEGSAVDPHLWLSPHTMSEMIGDLGDALERALGLDVSAAAASMSASLDALDEEISTRIKGLDSCTLVTGHDELGYFADRYGCTVVGAVIPSFSTTAEASAGELAELKVLVRQYDVGAIFTGIGTSADVVDVLSDELGVPAIELATHYLSGVSTYDAFMTRLVDQIVQGLS